MEQNQEYIVTALTENQIGVLNRITAIYLRRKINIESLRVSESSVKGISMFIISSITTEQVMARVVKQIKKIIEVFDAEYYTADDLITQEVALYKISKSIFENGGGFEMVNKYPGTRVLEMNGDYVVVEMTGTRNEVELLYKELKGSGALEQFSRSGSVVLHRESIEEKLNMFI